MPPSKHAPVKAKALIRREELMADRASGMTFKQIAEKWELSQRRVRSMIAEEFARLSESRAGITEDLARKQLSRLDSLLEAVWDEAQEGDIKAIAACLNVMDRQNRMLGLDAPAKIQGTLAYMDVPLAELQAQARAMGLLSSAPVPLLDDRTVEYSDCLLTTGQEASNLDQ